ncbi:MAG: 2-oxo acid dehydrogenase subunit E2 [Actinomycetota bacterium]|nr:2-oxo acid dehydrogenase subunit E2 [Actinomycetota bacterium]MDQ2956764.1 2-oxo acid dehydrogenase subunit E2 [Actinomycetota bacterium]
MTPSNDFLLPDLGEGLTDAEIISWLVAVGDTVTIDQPVVEVETAKASVEVPVPFAGKVTAIFGAPGERIPVGSPLISVASTDGPTQAAVSSEYSGNVLIGYGTSAAPSRRDRRLRKSSSPAAADLAVEAGLPPADRAESGKFSSPGHENLPLPSGAGGSAAGSKAAIGIISPVVRKLARDRGIDLATVTPTDPSGVIRRCDIEAISIAEAPAASSTERIPLTGLRRVAAERLSRSRREIPEATVWVDVDATALLDARRALNAADPNRPVSVLALVARFCVLGLGRYRELNSRITSDAIELLPQVNLGFAAQTSRGLMVPVVHDAQALTTRQLSAALSARTEAGRAGSLTPAQLSGGTFTVNNYGVFGVDGSAAIINHPEVAMLGLGRIIDRPWVIGGELAVRKVAELTLAFDHRACDGGVAGGFLRFVADCVENPVTALGEL